MNRSASIALVVLVLMLVAGCVSTPSLDTPGKRVTAAYIMHNEITNEVKSYVMAGLISPDDREKIVESLETALIAIDAAAAASSAGESPDTYLSAATTVLGMLKTYLLTLEGSR